MDFLMELMWTPVAVSVIVGIVLAALAYLDRIDDRTHDEEAELLTSPDGGRRGRG